MGRSERVLTTLDRLGGVWVQGAGDAIEEAGQHRVEVVTHPADAGVGNAMIWSRPSIGTVSFG